MVKKDININTFLVGVQKSATTSLFDWVSQHPDVCGPISMKDTPFFIDDKLFNKGIGFLNSVYSSKFKEEKIVLNGSAHYIYFNHSLKRIKEYNKNAKLILLLRNPVDRAISAYNFAVKRNLEKDTLIKAIEKEPQRLKSKELKILSETTYINHGLYYKQIKNLYNYFPSENVKILFYEDLKKKPLNLVKEVFLFLNIDENFMPEFRTLNKTGESRFIILKNLIYNDTKLKSFLIKNVLDKLVSHDLKYRIKIFFLRLITKKKILEKEHSKMLIDNCTKGKILSFFIDDINNLELLVDKDLSHWKKIK